MLPQTIVCIPFSAEAKEVEGKKLQWEKGDIICDDVNKHPFPYRRVLAAHLLRCAGLAYDKTQDRTALRHTLDTVDATRRASDHASATATASAAAAIWDQELVEQFQRFSDVASHPETPS